MCIRDRTDALRVFRQRTFPFRREQAFRRELQLEFLERDLQRAHAAQFDLPDDQLILAAHLIDRDIALQDDLLPVRQQRARPAGGVAKTHAAQLRARVLEREINVPGSLRAQIADLAAHPDRADALLQQPPDLRRQVADGQNLPRLLRQEQFAEVPL